MKTNPLLARFADQPALVAPEQATQFEACLSALAEHARFSELEAVASAEDFWAEDGGWCRPYTVVDGILQIPVKGILLNEFPYQFYGWATGYQYIWEAFKRGCADYLIGSIKGIALVINSPGGIVAECWDMHDKMVALKQKTGVPVRAFAHESAYSAAYGGVACVADSIVVSRTGGVGSIGTYTAHVDMSGAYAEAGIKITFIASDPSKVEGNSTEAPSAEFLARTQARINELNDIFVAAVARSRGLKESAIRDDLKAYGYTATQAVSNGLADSIGSLEDATVAFAAFLDEPSDNTGDDEMTNQVETVEKAVHDKAVADARAEGEAAAQTRIAAILGSDEATDRRALAEHFAFKTGMDADAAIAALAAAPKTVADAPQSNPGNGFEKAMNDSPNPEVGGNQSQEQQNQSVTDGSDVIALVRKAGLGGFRTETK